MKTLDVIKSLPTAIIIILLLVVCGYGYWKAGELENKNAELYSELTQLRDGVAAINTTKISEKDIKKLLEDQAKELSKAIRADKGKPKTYTRIRSGVRGGVREAKPIVDTPNLTKVDVYWPDKEVDGSNITIPIAWAEFKPKDKVWGNVGTYPLKFNVDVVESINKEGTSSVYAKLSVIDSNSTEYPLDITEMHQYNVEPKENSWKWGTHLMIGISGAKTGEDLKFGGSLLVSPGGYGKTKDDQFIRPVISISANDEEVWGGVGGAYNFGKHLPLLSDSWVDIQFCVDNNLNPGACVGLSSTY